MTTNYVLLSIFELFLIACVFFGILFEYKLIHFEKMLKKKIKNFVKGLIR